MFDKSYWKVVYHYTTLETFVNIVKSGKFRLSDITKSNDPLEGIFALNALENAYLNMRSKEECDDEEYRFMHRCFFEFNNELNSFDRPSSLIMSASFCIPEHELLLWRSYGDNGRGVAIGVAKETLDSLAESNEKLVHQEITYLSQNEMDKRAKQLWRKILDTFSVKESNIPEIVGELQKFYQQGYFIKEEANADEIESRLIFSEIDLNECIIPYCGQKIDNIDFCYINDTVRAYYEIDLSQKIQGRNFIDNVVLGPQCKISATEMRLFLTQHDLDCSITKINNISMR